MLKSRELRMSYRVGQSLFLVLAATLVSEYLFTIIPINKLPLSHYWSTIIERSISSGLALTFICFLYPQTFSRIRFKLTNLRFLFSIGFILFLFLPALFHSHFQSFSLSQIFEGFVFALFIGIDEEIFSRGLIFAALEQYGIWVAAIFSSIHFGLLHLGNVIWGGQSLAYTLAQVVNAVGFGFLCVGLMLYTGSIWVPILLHGLTDTSMQFGSLKVFTLQVTSNPNWPAALANAGIYCILGWVLIYLGRQDNHQKFVRRMKNYFLKLGVFTEARDQ